MSITISTFSSKRPIFYNGEYVVFYGKKFGGLGPKKFMVLK